MSKIKAELIAASGLKPNRGENDATFMARVVAAVGKDIPEQAWDALSAEAQDWNNAAANAVTQKVALPAFPDAEPDPAPAPSGRRRAAAEPSAPVAYVPAEGDEVEVKTKRGAVKVGFIVQLDATSVIINAAGKDGAEADDEEFKLENVTITKAPADNEPAGGAAEPEPNNEPEVGDTVEVITARGKTIVGNVEEITDDELVVKDSTGEVHELLQKNVKSVVVKVKNAGAAPAPAPAPAARGRGRGAAASPPAAPAAGEAPARTRSTNPGGISLGDRIRQIVCATPTIAWEDVCKQLTKENIQFRDPTVKLVVGDTMKVYDELKKLGKIK